MRKVQSRVVTYRNRRCEVYRDVIDRRGGVATAVWCRLRPINGSRGVPDPWPNALLSAELVKKILQRERTGHDSYLRNYGDGLPTWTFFLAVLDGPNGSPTREEIDELFEKLVEYVLGKSTLTES